MTTTEQLEELNRGIRGFVGVFAADQLPPKPPRGSTLIVNYSPSTEPGTHWVAMANLNGVGPAVFFDSYGEPPDSDDIVLSRKTDFANYLRRNGNGLAPTFNRFDLQAIQGPNNDVCGEYASFFIHAGGILPRVESRNFTGPWALFELDTRQLPRTITQGGLAALSLGDEKQEDVARRNDAIVRRWAGIIPVRN